MSDDIKTTSEEVFNLIAENKALKLNIAELLNSAARDDLYIKKLEQELLTLRFDKAHLKNEIRLTSNNHETNMVFNHPQIPPPPPLRIMRENRGGSIPEPPPPPDIRLIHECDSKPWPVDKKRRWYHNIFGGN